jgi:signal transduction histidine kinase
VQEELLGYGIVGGSLLSGKLHGVRAAEIALQILNGKDASSIPVDTKGSYRLMFDFNQLRRYGIDPDLVPEGSVVINKPESFYEKYPKLVWTTLGVALFLVSLIFFLVYIAAIRKQAARALQEKADELELHVAERTVELSETNRALKQEVAQRTSAQNEISWLNEDLQRRSQALESINRELEAFSYSVSHDLRAPLRHIEGFSRLLMEECGESLDTHAKEYLNRICRASNRMSLLIDDLINLSKVTRGELKRRPVSLTQMAVDIIEEFRDAAPQRQVSIHIAEGMTAWGDPQLLRVMLSNLLGNAWKYTSKNDLAEIEFGCKVENNEKIWFISDNGVGFDMTYAERLFGTFQRLHHANDFEGTGIGLATVQRIIARHDGRVWGEGQIGVGATFFFTLPEPLSLELPPDSLVGQS